jgi:GT2 family glycosyltransferase
MITNHKMTPTSLPELPESPLISIVILNYKRLKALEQSVQSALMQNYVNREIIVVDNHSEEAVADLVHGLNPGIKLIELPENLGTCGGRNAGIREAKGDIIITLDNDVHFASPFELTKIATKFQARPDIHVLAFQMCEADTGDIRVREWCHARHWKEFGQTEFDTFFFVEGGCAMRREVFEQAGNYYSPLFIGCEGHDLALRILDHGFRILYCPNIRVLHLMSAETRTSERPYYFYTRNFVWVAFKDYRVWPGLMFLLPKLAMMFYFALRTSNCRAYFRGVWYGIKGLPKVLADRTPVQRKTLRYLAELERWRPSLMVRLARHKEQVQL